MKRVLRIGKPVKTRRARVKELLSIPMEARDIDARVELIQALIPLGLLQVQDVLQEEVRALAGKRYKRNGVAGYDRWGSQWGSVYIGSQKVPTPVPRVRDRRAGKEVKLKAYEGLQEPRKIDEGIFRKILHGLKLQAV